jgi:hypothetical protein
VSRLCDLRGPRGCAALDAEIAKPAREARAVHTGANRGQPCCVVGTRFTDFAALCKCRLAAGVRRGPA